MRIGYLSIVELDGLGACGGLLIVNAIGRPVEFHCSTPVRPSRTQEILYGHTLRDFIHCEQIGARLLAECRVQPFVVLVDDERLLEAGADGARPIVFLRDADGEEGLAASDSAEIRLGRWRAELSGGVAPDESIREALARLHAALPVDEPFQRIRQAIDEAQSVAR